MKSIVVLVVLLFSASILAGQHQVISKTSNKLHFQSGKAGKLVSDNSNVLKFGHHSGHLIAVSQHMPFGKSREVVPEVIVAVQPETVNTASQNAVIEKPSERTVETGTGSNSGVSTPPAVTPAIVIAAAVPLAVEAKKPLGAELGDEYASALPRYHALIIGVSKYTYSGSGFESLENPTRDAKELVRVLTDKYSFEKNDVTFLEDPTRHQIIDAMELLSTKVGPKDNLLIFYAGHGYYDKQKELGYWLPSDARLTSKSEWIANSTVKDYLSTIPAKHTLLVTDACFGGSIFKTRSIDSYSMMKVYDLYKDPSRKAITSGNLTEVPDKSLFLDQLLKKLNDNQDDFLPAQKLFTRIYEPVTNNSTAIPKFGVIQGAGDEGGDFVFIRKPK